MPDYATLGEIAMSMRQDDVDELATVFDQTPYEALVKASETSRERYVVRFEGRPIAALGVAKVTTLGSAAAPWFLGTDEVLNHPRAMLQFGRAAVNHWLGRYTLLVNLVSARNEASVRWLRKIGFTLDDPFLIRGELTHRFWARRDS